MENGVDTDKQIDTDSFAGRYSHNANLSAKGILGIASYALLAKMLGKQEDAENIWQQQKNGRGMGEAGF